MRLTDTFTDDQRAAALTEASTGIEPTATLADVLAGILDSALSAQLEELSDDQWGTLTVLGAVPDSEHEDKIRQAFDDLAGYVRGGISEGIAAWRTDLAYKAADPVDVYAPAEDDDPAHWTVSGDLRRSEHPRGNYPWADEIKKRVTAVAEGIEARPGTLDAVVFDSEHSCFFAYCPDKDSANIVAGIARDVARNFTPPEN